jgi:hypothetical protein
MNRGIQPQTNIFGYTGNILAYQAEKIEPDARTMIDNHPFNQ